ncbi:D-alanyl-D-alanine carboxypeptidase family protein [Vagococcus elongatus]|uniref:Peptidase S11 D-alanyl-D-alanine carboxypeptidase A N-terminal domain-containing protein n=1 Tax=Vagococcus elongatus TaxID=180344 RepID=A0A430B4K0_9ENTE|nr:serine hydrolase [Vagococcus elongatus]RSU15233.1 hypothetical protein CBF29_02560 [Vagococcus elongatus]
MKKLVVALITLLGVTGLLLAFHGRSKNEVSLSGMTSDAIILTDFETGEVLAEKKSDKKIQIASLTKLMTALCVIESTANFNDTVILSEENLNRLAMEGMAVSGFSANDAVTVNDLLYGMMLPSGADAAEALAYYVSGSQDDFVMLMNNKAKELGLTKTHFSNVVGYDNKGNYSTAQDLMTLLTFALQSPLFKEIFMTQQKISQPTIFCPEGVLLESTLIKSGEHLGFDGGNILGGKTGYTNKAGLCLASMAEIQGRWYLLVNCHADGSPTTEPAHLIEAKEIYQRLAAKEGV